VDGGDAIDLQGLSLTTGSDEAAAAFDRTIKAYLKYRADTPVHLAEALAADPDFALAHCGHDLVQAGKRGA
jgi:hypothetical protein